MLAHNYPETPGEAVKPYWDLHPDDAAVLMVAGEAPACLSFTSKRAYNILRALRTRLCGRLVICHGWRGRGGAP